MMGRRRWDVFGTDGCVWHFRFRSTETFGLYKASLRVCSWGVGLRLLRMLGLGVQLSEVADDAHAAPSSLRGESRQLLGQLWRQCGQFGGGEVMVMHQLPAALQILSSTRESKQEALYWRANAGNWTERQR